MKTFIYMRNLHAIFHSHAMKPEAGRGLLHISGADGLSCDRVRASLADPDTQPSKLRCTATLIVMRGVDGKCDRKGY